MLLTLTTTRRPATDLGDLLAKHPARAQSLDLTFGKAHVFYPQAEEERCSAALLLDVDPIGSCAARGMARPPCSGALERVGLVHRAGTRRKGKSDAALQAVAA